MRHQFLDPTCTYTLVHALKYVRTETFELSLPLQPRQPTENQAKKARVGQGNRTSGIDPRLSANRYPEHLEYLIILLKMSRLTRKDDLSYQTEFPVCGLCVLEI